MKQKERARASSLHKLASSPLPLILAFGISFHLDVYAQIKTDGSLGKAAQSLSGPNYLIPQTLGNLVGNNLYQSFQVFNINSGQSATFTTTTPGIANVISRVTGGSSSLINGTLTLSAASGAPNFFLINPAGITFGAGAAINVPGAFHVSTADYIKFPDGNFYADATKTSSFSSATPESFGFLGTSRAAITINNGATVQPGTGQAISIVAGDINIDNASATTQGGDVRVIAVGQTVQEVGLSGALPNANGNLTITNNGTISQTASGATNNGSIAVSAGTIVLDTNGSISSTSFSATNAGSITVLASGNLSLSNSANIAADASGTGNAGTVAVTVGGALSLNYASISANGSGTVNRTSNAGTVNVSAASITNNNAAISADNYGAGDAGTVNVSAPNITMSNNGVISADSLSGSYNGKGGSVNVNATNLTMDGSATISASTDNTANAGTVVIAATGSLSMTNDAEITAYNGGTGNAGNIVITAGNINMDSGSIIDSPNSGFDGNAGNIKISTGNLTMAHNAQLVVTANTDVGNAGNIDILAAGNISITKGAGVFADTYGSGAAGVVTISTAGSVTMNGSEISVCSYDAGNAGAITVNAASIGITGKASSFSGFFADAESNATGNAGNVTLTTTGQLALTSGGQISASTYYSGDTTEAIRHDSSISSVAAASSAGFVTVNAGSLSIDGQGKLTGIYADTYSNGATQLGNVKVNTPGNISILNDGQISSSAYSSSGASAVNVSAGSITIDGQGNDSVDTGIVSFARPGSSGQAGNILVSASGNINIVNTGEITSSTFAAGNAGTVNVNAGSLTINGQGMGTGITSAAQGGAGNAGAVNVAVAGNITLLNSAQINSSTFSSGNAGAVNISAGNMTIDGTGNSQIATAVASEATSNSSGQAGIVTVKVAGNLDIVNTGEISTSTFASGAAGSINVSAGNFTASGNGTGVTGVFSSAGSGSGGQTGSVVVSAANSINLLNGAELQVSNTVTVANPSAILPTSLTVTAPDIFLQNSSAITTNALGNTAASSVIVNASREISLNSSSGIETHANLGNGGAITVSDGSGVIALNNAQISSSVVGAAGNGGDITVQAKGLVLNTGFIQANTTAAHASGGNINIDAQTLIASDNTLFLAGGDHYSFQPDVIAFNVIQAAATSSGVNGTVLVTSPVLNLASSLTGLNTYLIDSGGLGRSPCQIGAGSSLAHTGRGGFVASSRELLGPGPVSVVPANPDAVQSNAVAPVLVVAQWGCTK